MLPSVEVLPNLLMESESCTAIDHGSGQLLKQCQIKARVPTEQNK